MTGDVVPEVTTGQKVSDSLLEKELPRLMSRYPGLSHTFEVLVMYVLIAVPFKSYIQPLVVLSAIPFGIVGAIIGHLIMGYIQPQPYQHDGASGPFRCGGE